MDDRRESLTDRRHRDHDRRPPAQASPYAPILGDAGPSTGRAVGGADVEFIHKMKCSGESRQLVGTAFGDQGVWATVATYEDGSQRITYTCPTVRRAIGAQDVVRSETAVMFGRRLGTVGLLMNTLDRATAIAFVAWLQLDKNDRKLPTLTAPASP